MRPALLAAITRTTRVDGAHLVRFSAGPEVRVEHGSPARVHAAEPYAAAAFLWVACDDPTAVGGPRARRLGRRRPRHRPRSRGTRRRRAPRGAAGRGPRGLPAARDPAARRHPAHRPPPRAAAGRPRLPRPGDRALGQRRAHRGGAGRAPRRHRRAAPALRHRDRARRLPTTAGSWRTRAPSTSPWRCATASCAATATSCCTGRPASASRRCRSASRRCSAWATSRSPAPAAWTP